MHRNTNLALILIIVMLAISCVSAIPTTDAATLVGNNNVTFKASGASGPTWFLWGFYSGKLYLKTTNVTPAGGVACQTVWDYPIYGSTTYYVKACDVSGCGGEVSFVTPAVTPLPTTTYGNALTNLTESHFNLAYVIPDAIEPYLYKFNESSDMRSLGLMLLVTLSLSAIFLGMWMRGRNVAIPVIATFVCSGLFITAGNYSGITIMPEYLAIGQGVFYASLAGLIMAAFKKG